MTQERLVHMLIERGIAKALNAVAQLRPGKTFDEAQLVKLIAIAAGHELHRASGIEEHMLAMHRAEIVPTNSPALAKVRC